VTVEREFTLVQDFIVGRLSDDECRAFEDRLVRDPALVRALEQSLRMREGLQQLRSQGYFRKAASRKSLSPTTWVPALAAAAVAALALFLWVPRVGGPAAALMSAPESFAAAGVAPSIAAHFTFVTTRSGSAPDLELPASGLIEFRVAPSTHAAEQRYRITLVRHGPSADTVGSVSGLAPGADGYVHCYADAARLAAGGYVLRLQPDTNAPGTTDVFPFSLSAGSSR
jgi:hypothetical protein